MKHLLLIVLLFAGVTGCSKKADPAPDPLLGHWQASTLEILSYDATGKLVDDHTFSKASQLDVTASTITTTQTVNGQIVVDTQTYTRNGEALTLARPPAGFTCYCRKLSASSFTFEYNQNPIAGQPYTIQLVAYSR